MKSDRELVEVLLSGGDEAAFRELYQRHTPRLYQIVLSEGRLPDICRFIDADALVRLWPGLWLSPHVRTAWRPLLDAVAS